MTKVLLVEDDAWLAELEARSLTKEGFEVTIAAHGFEAIDLVDSLAPDVIILDLLLGGSTAFALLHELQSYQDTVRIPVILCTNLAEQFTLEQLAPYGVRRIIDKMAMAPDELAVAIRTVLPEGGRA